MQTTTPFNVELLDVQRFIDNHGVRPIISLAIYEPSSSVYKSDGLFSEEIFGLRGSNERLITFGYIALNTRILQPVIYKNLIKLASLYEEIMSGASYAIFDEVNQNFRRCADPEHHPEAGTGYSFFLTHLPDLVLTRNTSRQRSDRIDMIEKYRDRLFCTNFLVLPAGLRDLEEEQGTLTTDDINKLYQTLLSMSFAIPPGAISSIYDGLRFQIQKRTVEIYDYIENILTGKNGFIQGTWGHRNIALGTRNVITATSYATMTPNDPQTIQPDETKIGLFQTMKAIQPVVVHYVRAVFFDQIFGHDTHLVPLTDPDTLTLTYRELSAQELNRFDNPAAIENWISRFRNIDVRNTPVTIIDRLGKMFYLLMVYDEGDQISLFRNIDDFRTVRGGEIDRKKIHPITWLELFYLATVNAARDKHVFITRYPVIQDESCYPTKIHLCTTIPSRTVTLRNTVTGEAILTYPEYPILGKPYLDSVQVGTSRLMGLGGDKEV